MNIGTDITEISRFENLNDNFFKKVFTEYERSYCDSKAVQKYASFAGIFSAKEAFSKAVGTGVRGFNLNEVEIKHNDLGAPYVVLYGRANELFNKMNFSVSISHSGEYALASVISY